MSDVIEVMAAAMSENWAEGTDEELASDAIAALRAAEQAGWRLVPVEATPDMVAAIRDHLIDFSGRELWHEAIQAAPRPWENSDE